MKSLSPHLRSPELTEAVTVQCWRGASMPTWRHVVRLVARGPTHCLSGSADLLHPARYIDSSRPVGEHWRWGTPATMLAGKTVVITGGASGGRGCSATACPCTRTWCSSRRCKAAFGRRTHEKAVAAGNACPPCPDHPAPFPAAAGIGEAACRLFVKEGARVVVAGASASAAGASAAGGSFAPLNR